MSEPVLVLSAQGELPATLPLSAAAAEKLRQAFIQAITVLSVANADRPGWWFTWASSRDRFNAKTWSRLVALARLAEDLGQAGPISLGCDDPWLAEAMVALAQSRGWRVKRRLADRLRWGLRRLVPAGWLAMAKEMRRAIRLRRAARAQPKSITAAEVVLIAPLSEAPLRQAGAYRDPYFGQLPDYLGQNGETCLHFGDVQGDPLAVVKAAADRAEPIVTLGHLLGWTDLAAAAWVALRPLKTRGVRLPWGNDARALLADDLRRARGQVFLGALMQRGCARLLALLPRARIIHTYENNPWERAVDVAAHAAGRSVIGYLHCAVLKAHMKNVITIEEQGLRPAPDRIVCTGPSARALFLSLGAHDGQKVAPGCALRGPSLTGLPRRAHAPRQITTVLAVLEGLPSMVKVLRLLDHAARLSPRLRVLARAHPALPLSVLAPQAGIVLGEHVHESGPSDLMAALDQADVVLYQGTTAAMTALYCGIPLVRLRLDDTVDDDPLSACPHLKAEISQPEELMAALAGFTAMDDIEFENETTRARAWIDGAMAAPDAHSLKGFLP